MLYCANNHKTKYIWHRLNCIHCEIGAKYNNIVVGYEIARSSVEDKHWSVKKHSPQKPSPLYFCLEKENICFHLFRKCDYSIIFSILHHHQLEWCFQSGHSGEKTKGESAIHQPPPCLPLNLSSSPPQSSFSTNSNSNPQPWHLSCHHHHSPFPPTQCHPQHFRRL